MRAWLKRFLGIVEEPVIDDIDSEHERREYLKEMLNFDMERLRRIELETRMQERTHGDT